MTAEQEQENATSGRPKRSWNSSTKLPQPRRAESTPVRASFRPAENARRQVRPEHEDRRPKPRSNTRAEEQPNGEIDQRRLTRELLERAVSTAFGGLLQDSVLDATAFPDVDGSQSSELSGVGGKENNPPTDDLAAKIASDLQNTLKANASLSSSHRQRRRDHAEALQQANADSCANKEFHRRMKHAAFEHRERKMAVQALQARIQREIHYLTATAADLEKREFLLDDAFESYERALRLELGLADSASPTTR